jgi:DNA polymerase-3 subunit delta'
MRFAEVIGHTHLKQRLMQQINQGRISHAQLFLGPEGSGNLALALAYATYVSCENRGEEDSCGVCASCRKYDKLAHPDLHLVFPVNSNKPSEQRPLSDTFIQPFRQAIQRNAYLNLFEWMEILGMDNKQGNINTEEGLEIIRKLSLKAFESPFKIMLIWMAERMNGHCANRLLKILEEPPEGTLFLLVVEQADQLLPTILSRTQLVKVPALEEEDLMDYLRTHHQQSQEAARETARLSDGNLNEALRLLSNDEGEKQNQELFQQWMRYCYKASMPELIAFTDQFTEMNRERQKSFLLYCLSAIRQNLLLTLGLTDLALELPSEASFNQRFHPFINEQNGSLLSEWFNKAFTDLERNANPRFLFLDLSLQLAESYAQQRKQPTA